MFKSSVTALFALIAVAKDGSEFNGDAYIAQSRTQKSDQIWARIIEDTSTGPTHLIGALTVDQRPVFGTLGDELVCSWNGCRNKTIHA